jgi:glycosyltransferase involved in cell wall biosynthesis
MSSGVTLVTTAGRGSMDRYGQMLAAHLGIERVELDLAATSAGAFGLQARGDGLRRLRRDVGLLRLLRRRAGPLHLTSHHLARYANLLEQPVIVTAHDVIRLLDARDGTGHISRPGPRDRLWIELDYRGIRRAAAVIAPSAATRADLLARLALEPGRVFVVHEGVDHDRFRPVAARRGVGPYILFVGSEHPRKNLAAVLRALADLKRHGELGGARLVKVGAAGSGEADFHRPVAAQVRSLGLERDVEFAGEVPDDELASYYSSAACMVLPSWVEGFGLPLLEAMACGCPVVASTAGALPEVAGDAALLVAPGDDRGLRAALGRLLRDPRARAELRERGLARARRFSWQRAAAETQAIYDLVTA